MDSAGYRSSPFCGVTYYSLHDGRGAHLPESRYVWWASTPLDSDPLNRRTPACVDGKVDCNSHPASFWIDPGILSRSLLISAAPVFSVGGFVVKGAGHRGVSEFVAFMTVMPPLIFACYYTVGLLIDHWLYKRARTV